MNNNNNNDNNNQEQSGDETNNNQTNKNKNEEEHEIIKEACINGDINIIKKSLFSENNNNNFDINKLFEYTTISDGGIVNTYESSLLHICCVKGYLEIVKLLCSHPNINLNLKNKFGRTPFHEVCENKVCFSNHLNIIQFLCEIDEVDINLENNYGWTPFHSACWNNSIEIIKILLKQQNRIEINKQNNYGNSALRLACYYDNLEIIKLLCEEENENNKIDINLRNKFGKTAFYNACESGYLEIVKCLFFKYKNEIDYENQITNKGFSPLHILCLNGKVEIVKFVLENNTFNEIENKIKK